MLTAILMICGNVVFLTSCKNTKVSHPLVAGTIEEAFPADSAPSHVVEVINKATRFHQHEILGDSLSDIAVFSLDEADDISAEGWGFVVVKGSTSTTFPHIRNTRQPMARYDKETENLWLTSSAMEGTGVSVEWLYQIRFKDDNTAYVAAVVNPYDVQQALCQRLGYNIDGQEISLYDGERLIGAATNTITDMGGFDADHPLWIGEQLCYDISGKEPYLIVTPGIKYTTGLVLTYDDMPMVTGRLTIGEGGKISVHEVEILSRPS